MNTTEQTKKAYSEPETTTIKIAPEKSILDISNPTGDVPPIDPDEG